MIPYSTDAPIYHRPHATVALMVGMVLLTWVIPADQAWDPVDDVLQRAEQRAEAPAAPPPPAERWDADDFAAPVEGQAPPPEPEEAAEPLERSQPRENPLLRFLQRTHFRLHFGEFSPLQWVFSPFLQQGIGQLIINLIYLWAFGLVIEGKIGWYRFLGLFVSLAVLQGAATQAFGIFSSGSTSGADALLLAMLGVSAAWAPKNSFEVWFGPWIGSFEITILMFGFLELLFGLFLLGTTDISALGGLVLGLGVGLWWVKAGWVDCEGWDLVSVWNNRHIDVPKETHSDIEAEAEELVRSSRKQSGLAGHTQMKAGGAKQKKKAPSKKASSKKGVSPTTSDQEQELPPSLSKAEQAKLDIEQLIADQHLEAAAKLRDRFRADGIDVRLSQAAQASMIRQYLARQDYDAALPVMQEHVEMFDEGRTVLQLNLAKILLHQQRPSKAKSILRSIEKTTLSEAERAQWNQLAAHVRRQINEGVIELSD